LENLGLILLEYYFREKLAHTKQLR
jgi:hypothetical protein